MIDLPEPIQPPDEPPQPNGRPRRPPLGRGVVRGLWQLWWVWTTYSPSGYIPIRDVPTKTKRDIRHAINYIGRLVGWKMARDDERKSA